MGIAMGGIGSDISIDAADIVLVDDKVEELPHLLVLSKRMMHTIQTEYDLLNAAEFCSHRLSIHGASHPCLGSIGP